MLFERLQEVLDKNRHAQKLPESVRLPVALFIGIFALGCALNFLMWLIG